MFWDKLVNLGKWRAAMTAWELLWSFQLDLVVLSSWPALRAMPWHSPVGHQPFHRA